MVVLRSPAIAVGHSQSGKHSRAIGAGVSDIFREIEDELRRENLLQLWRRYGKYLIAAVVVALVAAGGVALWRNHQSAVRQAEGARYSAAMALARAGKNAEAAKAFAALAQGGGGYRVLARFEEAEMQLRKGDRKGAIATYDRLAGASGISRDFRQLAVLLSVMHGLSDGNAKAAVARLEPLTRSGMPWRASALDLTAAAKLTAGDRAGALKIYKELADDLAAPQHLRARAAELAAALKS